MDHDVTRSPSWCINNKTDHEHNTNVIKHFTQITD